jgi:L-fuconolactonase
MPLEVRDAWLARVQEDIIEPERRIVDPHHHFFVPGGDFPFYDLDLLWADTATHHVEQTVFLQCWEGYRTDGLEDMRVVGETEWVDGIAARARQDPGFARVLPYSAKWVSYSTLIITIIRPRR